MNSTGIIRRIDDLGRVVIPREIRQRIHIHEGDPLEICIANDGNGILLRRYSILEIDNNIVSIAVKMASKAQLHGIAIYDKDFRIYGSKTFPDKVLCKWKDFYNYNKIDGYGVYPIICQGEHHGYLVCPSEDSGTEVMMIQHYLSAALD